MALKNVDGKMFLPLNSSADIGATSLKGRREIRASPAEMIDIGPVCEQML